MLISLFLLSLATTVSAVPVDLSHIGYNEILGQRLLLMSIATFCSQETVKSWTCTPCEKTLPLTEVTTITSVNEEAFVVLGYNAHLNSLFAIFRGYHKEGPILDSQRTKNRHEDYLPCQSKCKVQSQMYENYLAINDQFQAAVKDYYSRFNFTSIVVTGFSIGGALAVHAVAHLLSTPHHATHLYNFGAPRVGNSDFVRWFRDGNKKMNVKARVTHAQDPVLHQPRLKFQHISGEIFYPGVKSGGFIVCADEEKEDERCSAKHPLGDFSDHMLYYDIDIKAGMQQCAAP